MPRSPRIDRRRTRRGSWPRASVLIVASLSGVALAALAGMALAKTRTTLGSARNAALGKTILVDGRGLTVYELSPETTHHLLCTKAAGCFSFWPPVTVKSSKTKLSLPAGVKGKLTTLHRNGFFQLVLSGHPLYRFAPDGSVKGHAFGEGIVSFGGTWHTVKESAAKKQTVTTTTTTTTTTTPTNPYGY